MQSSNELSEKQKTNLRDEVADFIIRYSKGLYSWAETDLFRRIVERHIEFKTIYIVRGIDGSIIAVARWNIEKNLAHLWDFVVRKNNEIILLLLVQQKPT